MFLLCHSSISKTCLRPPVWPRCLWIVICIYWLKLCHSTTIAELMSNLTMVFGWENLCTHKCVNRMSFPKVSFDLLICVPSFMPQQMIWSSSSICTLHLHLNLSLLSECTTNFIPLSQIGHTSYQIHSRFCMWWMFSNFCPSHNLSRSMKHQLYR